GEWQKEGELFCAIANPALAVHDTIIYIFNEGSLIAFDTTKKLLQQYRIRLPLKDSQLKYYNNSLFVIGGYFEDQFSTRPSSDVYKIDLNELSKTRSKSENLTEIYSGADLSRSYSP
ncbi:MAG: hypothetical protein ABFS16_16555, partial [Bacteroidota bacterium]